MEPPGGDDNSKPKQIDIKYNKLFRWNPKQEMTIVNLIMQKDNL